MKKLTPTKYDAMIWHTQVGNLATNMKFRIYFTLPDSNKTQIGTLDFHLDEFTKI